LKKRVYWDNKEIPLTSFAVSTEPLLLSEAENELRTILIPPEVRDLNSLVIYGWEADTDKILEFLNTMPFLAENRLLVLREVQNFKEWKTLLPYIEDPNPASCLLITSSELKKRDAAFRELSRKNHFLELKKPFGKGMTGWVKGRFADLGKEIDGQLADILLELVGNSMTILASEIDKIAIYSGDSSRIERSHLDVIVPGGIETIFSMLDALGEGDGKKALSALKILLENDSRPEYLIHMIARHYRQLLKGRAMADRGVDPISAASKLGIKYKNLQQKFARQVGRANEKDLYRAVDAISRCDRDLKNSRVPEHTLLDKLVVDLLV